MNNDNSSKSQFGDDSGGSDKDTKATIPPLFPRNRVCSDESSFDATLSAYSDGGNANTKTLRTRACCSESSIDTTCSTTPLSSPRVAGCCSDSSNSNDGYDTPKEQLMKKQNIIQSSSPRGVMEFDDDDSSTSAHITGSESSDDYSQVTLLPSLHSNLMTCHQRQDPNEYYQFLEILGEGSMGSVCRVRKRVEVIGGSARSAFVQSKQKQQANIAWKFLQSYCFLWCPFTTATNSHSSSRDLFQAMHDDEEEEQNSSSMPDIDSARGKDDTESSSSHSKLISHDCKDLEYALKTINLDRVSPAGFMKELENEVEILKDLDHPNIVRPIETFANCHNQLFIVLELCNGGDLYSRDPYTEQDAAKIVKSVLGAIAYMHARNIIHRDIKFENIMFTSNDESADVKLIDFGLSKKYASGSYLHDTVGTVYTMAPELLRGSYTSSVDVWSMGVVTYMLLSSSMPFFGKDRDRIIRKIIRGRFRFSNYRWKFVSSNARKFISLLLKQDPKKRPTAEQALKHSWLNRKNRDSYHQQAKTNTAAIAMMDHVQAAIETFTDYVTLKKLALMIVAYKSTSQEIGFLRPVFDKFDRLSDGVITLPAFKLTLEDYLYSDEELERMFMGMDIDGNGTVNYCEFLAATMEAHGSIDEQRLAEAFDRLDCDNSGDISVHDLRTFLGGDGDIPQAFLEEAIAAVNLKNHDQKVSYDEFLTMWDGSDDEKRMANQLQVQQRRRRRIQRVDSKQSLTSITSSESGMTSSDSEMSFCGSGFSDELEITGRFEFMRHKMADEAENVPNIIKPNACSPPLTRQRRSNNIPPMYPSKKPIAKTLQRKRHRATSTHSSKCGTTRCRQPPPGPLEPAYPGQHMPTQQQHVAFKRQQHFSAVNMNYPPLYSPYPQHVNYVGQHQHPLYQWYYSPGQQSQQQHSQMHHKLLQQ